MYNGFNTAADRARREGWTVGTKLRGVDKDALGTDGKIVTRDTYVEIEITAIGRERVLAVTPETGRESSWYFEYRNWTVL